eukprot:1095928-Rhodomonas_salina.1
MALSLGGARVQRAVPEQRAVDARSRPEENAPTVGSSTTGLYGDMVCASPTDYPPSIQPASTAGVRCSMQPPASLFHQTMQQQHGLVEC